MKTVILFRPTGPEELNLVKQSSYKEWPPRLPEQPIFYPVLDEEYAIQIPRDWNAKECGFGYVTRFEVDANYLVQFEVQKVGGHNHLEYWIPAEELGTFNQNIIGEIHVIHEFRNND